MGIHLAFKNRKSIRNLSSDIKSHCISTLQLIFEKKETSERYKVSMTFVDCATYCKETNTSSQSSSYLNLSFLSLGNVLTSLHREQSDESWKDNVLTQTLHSLCTANANAKALLILNCTLNTDLYEETLATLRFGNLAMTDPMLLSVMDNYQQKIKTLQAKMKKYK